MFNRDGGPTVANSLSVPDAWWDDFEKICEPLTALILIFLSHSKNVNPGQNLKLPVEPIAVHLLLKAFRL